MESPPHKPIDIAWRADPASPWLAALRAAPRLRVEVEGPRPVEVDQLDAGRVHVLDVDSAFRRLAVDPALDPAACLVALGPRNTLEDPIIGAADLFLPADVEPCAPELADAMIRSAALRSRRRRRTGRIEDYFLAAMSHELRTPLN
ncbi:MAG: hypothetical protein AAGF23_19130, partial [Acidobacteriota bacterium]